MSKVPLNVKKAIRDIFEQGLPELQKKIEDATLENFDLIVNWEELVPKVNEKYIGEDLVNKVFSYFFYTTSFIQKKCRDDDLIGEALLEECTSRRIVFEIVDKTPGKRDPNTQFEQGVMYIRTTAENFGERIDEVAAHFEENFEGFEPTPETFVKPIQAIKAPPPKPPQMNTVQNVKSQYVILRLSRNQSQAWNDSLTIDGPIEVLKQFKFWSERNLVPNPNYRETAEIYYLQGPFQKQLFIQGWDNNILYDYSITTIMEVMEGFGFNFMQMQLTPQLEVYILKSEGSAINVK
ncbi:hypothetical protein G9A89_002849 [Geosiphon pyriformis]|nr:hypothetical protein G9A89_002849 [Geosiphon pyriformis]